ncbi:MAG: VWA domain-containing protein [Terriglobales bacterium]
MLSYSHYFGRAMGAAALTLSLLGLPVAAQQQTPPPPPSQTKPQQAPPEAGGPGGDIGPIIVPKKGEAKPAPPPPSKPQKIEGMPEYSIQVNTSLVSVPVLVTTKEGQFIPHLQEGNFKIYEDGVEQKITKFEQVSNAPITAVMLIEFASTNYSFMEDALRASYVFADSLKKDDWVAVISYDMRDYILTDFTQDKSAVFGALNSLRIPGFSETNVFDALYDTLDRVNAIDGRKYVILIGSGRDTFSKLTYDKILKKIKETPDVTIFTISTGEIWRMWMEANYGMNQNVQMAMMDYLQADNEMNTFSKMTGGRWYKPRFEGELPEIFRDIASDIRNQYVISYHPANSKLDGSYRKLKVELVGPDGKALKVHDQKGKDVKYNINAREGYTAKHQVE